RLREDGYEVLETDIRPGTGGDYVMADINHPVDLLPAFDWGPEIVFVLSAMVSRVTCEQASGLAIATNLAGVNNVLQLCKRVGAPARVRAYTVINVGHPDVRPIEELAELVRAELGAPEELLRLVDLPPQMTLVKNPSLERQRTILGVEPEVSLEDGVRRVCET